MNFDFGSQKVVESTGKRLTAGIKNATFMGVEFATVTKQSTGDSYKTLSLKLDIEDYGEYTQNFFEPQSDERKTMAWGLSASPLDHFFIIVREILEAVDPQIMKDIDADKKKLSGSFKQICDTIKQWTAPAIGNKKVQVKLIPGNNGYVSMPSFVARITKDGDLGIATRVIGQDLVLTSSEAKKIETANTAKPTVMEKTSTSTDDLLTGMAKDLDSTDDLPFA